MDDRGSRVPAAAGRNGRVRHVTSVCLKKGDSREPRPRLGRAEAALLAQAKRGVDCLTYHCGLQACRSVVSALEIDVPAWRRVGGKTPPSLVGHQSDPGKSRILQSRCGDGSLVSSPSQWLYCRATFRDPCKTCSGTAALFLGATVPRSLRTVGAFLGSRMG